MAAFISKGVKRWRAGLMPVAAAVYAAVPAAADSNLNCSAYATKAVEQQKQNEMLGCGFAGPPWSRDFNGHFGWCALPNVQMADLTREDAAREGAIDNCYRTKQTQAAAQINNATQAQIMDALFSAYAMDARAQNQENRQFACNYGGGRWSDDVNGHRAWCLQAGWNAARDEDGTCNVLLNDCKRAGGRCTRESDCGAYLCNTDDGACFTSCRTTMAHCAKDFVCDTDSRCKHKSNF